MVGASFTGSGDLSSPSTTRVLRWASASFTGTGSLSALSPLRSTPEGPRWRVVIVDIEGAPIAELSKAKISPITWTLNSWETVSVAFRIDDPAAHYIFAEKFREIQIWRDRDLMFFGPMVRPAVSETGLAAVDAKGPLWYFSRRNVGRAGRENYVTNGDFELGMAGWSVDYFSPVEPAANRTGPGTNYWSSISSSRAMTGRRSLFLEMPDPDDPEFGIAATQTFVATVDPGNFDGDSWTLVAYAFIPDGGWIGPNSNGIGMRLGRFSTTETVTLTAPGSAPADYPAPIETVEVTLDEDTPRGKWVRFEATFVAPVTGEAEFIQAALLSPIGEIYWDRVSLVQDESLRFYEEDQATIAGELVEHLQDPTFGKTDLNIDTSTPATGVLRDRTYRFSEHPPGFDALDEFPSLSNGFDHSVQITATTRTYTTHYPQRGQRIPTAALEWGKNIATYAWAYDGEVAANSIVVLGQGDGPDREEGEAFAPALFADGLLLETMLVAPPTSAIDALDDLAEARLAVESDPEILSVTTHRHETALLGIVNPGDIVPVRIYHGALEVDDDFRIVSITLDPDLDSLSFVLHRRLTA